MISIVRRVRKLIFAVTIVLLGTDLSQAEPVYQTDWIRQFDEQDARSVFVNANGEVLVGTGTSLRKYTTSGDLISTLSIQVPSSSIAQDVDGNIYVCGRSNGTWVRPSAGQTDVVFSKLDPSGNVLWMHQWGDANADGCAKVVVHPTAGVFTSSYGGLNIVSVRRFDAAGNENWVRQPTNMREGDGLAVDTVGNVYVAGYGIDAISEPALIAKLNLNGQQDLSVTLNSPERDVANAVEVDAQGNIFVTGAAGARLGASYGGGDDIFAAKIGADGTPIWISQLGTGFARFEYGRDIAVNSKGEVFVVGERTTATRRNGIVAKFGVDGVLLWTTDIASPEDDYIFSIAVDAHDNIFIAGDTRGSLGGPYIAGWDGFVAKLSPVPVPEPNSIWLAIGATAILWLRGRRRV
jgi:hypothetical protein